MFHRLRVVLLACAVGVPSLSAAQDGAVAGSRGPRFLVASRDTKTLIPVDIARTPVLSRRVSVELDNLPLDQALKRLGALAGFTLSYSTVVPLDRRVRLKATDITVAAALTEVLLDADVDVVFSTSTRALLVPRSGGRKEVPLAAGAVAGLVRDANTKERIAGVEVWLEGTRWRTNTDSGGRYRLSDVDTGTYTLIARRLGYTKQSRRVVVREAQEDTANFALDPAAVQLDQLVTTATGPQRRRDLGNAITTINADSVLQNAPIRNLTDLLNHRVPGLTVQHTSGAPGDPARLRLRGLSSVLRSNDPVVIVDGVRVYAAQSGPQSGNLTNFGTLPNGSPVPAPSPLDQIDPNTIEKIEVFNGPSAATLYGADAANGVLVITTKKGRPGPTEWRGSITHGITVSPGQYPMGYYRWGHPFGENTAKFCTILDVNCIQDSLVRFQALNDRDLTILGRGHRTTMSLTASGGTQVLTYSLTGTYGNDVGLLTLPAFEIDRFRAQFNREAPDWMRRPHHYTDWSVTNHISARLSATADLTLTTRLSRSEQHRTPLENQLAPLSGTYVDSVNHIYARPGANSVLDASSSILASYYTHISASTTIFTTGLNANWHPRSWFTASGQAGLDVSPRDDQAFLPAGIASAQDSGAFVRGTGHSVVGTFNLQGTVRRPLGRSFFFETNVGANLTSTTTDNLVSSASGLVPGTSSISRALRVTGSDDRSSTSVYGWYVEPRLQGQRITLSTGLRLDGGSAYGTRISGLGGGGGRGFLRGLLALPKIGGSWVISEEPWFPLGHLFSSLRLRGAYGQAQTQPGLADRLRLYQYSTLTDQTVLLSTLGNTELRPERKTELEGGLDADIFNGQLSLAVTAYRQTKVDALMNLPLPGSVNGGGTVTKNIGTVRNTGLEFTVGTTPLRSRVVTWGTQLNFSQNDNKLVALGRGVDPNPLDGLVAGYPIGGRWARPIVAYADVNGDGVLQYSDRQGFRYSEIQLGDNYVYLGRLLPAYTMALSTSLVLFGGAVTASADFSYDAGATQVDLTAQNNWVLTRALVDPATPLNQQAAVIASTSASGRSGPDLTEYGITQTVSTLRFNSLSANFRAPARVARLVGAQALSVAVQGSNLALHSTYKGKDPDVSAWDSGERIVDTGQLGLPRLWQVRVDVKY